MERTAANIKILGIYLRCYTDVFPANYVQEFDAFYYNHKLSEHSTAEVYITWDKAVESYNQWCNKLLNIK